MKLFEIVYEKKVNLITLSTNHARYSSISLLKYIYKNKPKILLVFSYDVVSNACNPSFFIEFKNKNRF